MGTYAVGLGVLGVGLVGYWLLGPKSKSTESPPAGIPSLNQSLRGTSVPVTFGTNRVAPQVTWTNNFKAVRQKSSGKGGAKGGGSGGMGSAKGGGSAGQLYEYYWDMMFNFGIVDQPSVIRRGWVGGDNIDQSVISALTAGVSDDVIAFFPIETKIKDKETAIIKFQEAFFAPGYNAGDTNLSSWDYFETETGEPCAFPSQLWLGFEQMDLGNAPTVPQLTLEVCPSVSGFTSNPGFKSISSEADFSTSWGRQTNGFCFLIADGKRYTTIQTFPDGQNTWVFCVDDDAYLTTLTKTKFLNDRLTLFGVATSSGITGFDYIPIPGTPYIAAWAINNAITLSWVIIYEIVNDDYVIKSYGSGTTSEDHRIWQHDGVYYDGTHLYFNCKSPFPGGFENRTVTWPFAAWLSGPGFAGFAFDTCMISTAPATNFDDPLWVGEQTGHRKGISSVCADTQAFYVYYGKIDIDWMDANPGTNDLYDLIIATYGTGYGGLFRIFQTGGSQGVTRIITMDDAGKDLSGTLTGNANDDYSSPQTAKLADGTEVFLFARTYSSSTDRGTGGSKMRVKIYTTDGVTLKADKTVDGAFDYATLGLTSRAADLLYVAPGDTSDIWFAWWNNTTAAYMIYGTALNFSPFTADVTPPYIIKRILTSDIFGFSTSALFGFTPSVDRIDDASYQAAVKLCEDQGIKISVTYKDAGDLLGIINDLLSLYNGFLTANDGVIQFGVASVDDEPIRVLDNSHFVVDQGKPPIQVKKAALEDGYNKVQYNFFDRNLDYKQSQVEASDEVDIDFNGPRVKTVRAQYVMAGSTAQNLCTRALWNNLYGNDQYTFKLGWKDADLKPGALVTLVDSFDSTLSGGVNVRILKWQEQRRGVFTVDAVQQRNYIISASTSHTDASSINQGFGGLVSPPAIPMHQTAYELPAEFNGAKSFVYFGYAQDAQAMGAQLYLSTDGENYVLTQDTQPFIISGALSQPLQHRSPGWCEERVEFYVFPASGFSVDTPTFVQTYAMDDISAALRAQGAGTLIVGSEAVAIEGLTLLGQNHYRAKRMFRGWGGTPISAHNSGEWFHQHAAGIFQHEISADDIGNKLSYKIAPYNFIGNGPDISSIVAQSYEILGFSFLSREASPIRTFVESALSYTGSSPIKPNAYVAVTSGGCDIAIGWSPVANNDGFGAQGFGNSYFGHWEPDVAGVSLPSYRVEVRSVNGTTVFSTVVYTGYFNYTIEQNSADFGGPVGNLDFLVTPFNTKGDCLIPSSASIRAFW